MSKILAYISLILSIVLVSCVNTPPATVNNSFEKEIVSLEAKDKTETYPDNSILFIGSSSIRLWRTLAEDMKPYPVIQRGFGGSRFTDVLYYTPRLVYPHKIRALVIFVANDIVGAETDKSPAEVEALFKQFSRLVRKKTPGLPIFYIAVTPTPSRWSVWSKINEGNLKIASYCQSQNKMYFINTTPEYLTDKGEPIDSYFVGDKLHQNAQGYAVWSKIIKNALDSNLK